MGIYNSFPLAFDQGLKTDLHLNDLIDRELQSTDILIHCAELLVHHAEFLVHSAENLLQIVDILPYFRGFSLEIHFQLRN